jgi:hypothetical protein
MTTDGEPGTPPPQWFNTHLPKVVRPVDKARTRLLHSVRLAIT